MSSWQIRIGVWTLAACGAVAAVGIPAATAATAATPATKPTAAKPVTAKPVAVKPGAASRTAAARPVPVAAAAGAAAAQSAPASSRRYTLDVAQSSVGFTFQQAGARAQGRFRQLRSTLDCKSTQPADCALTVEVVTASVDTQDKDRDALLRGALLFDAQKFAVARFVSQQLAAASVTGTLTLRDHSRPLTVPLVLRFTTEAGHPVAWLSGEFPINRLDFGVGQGEWASTESVANAVTVNFRLRLVATR